MDTLSSQGRSDEILCLNVGTSSVKAARYVRDLGGDPVLLGHAERPAGPDAIDALLRELVPDDRPPAVVAHRVVHGGPDLVEHTIVDDEVRSTLEQAVPFAPLHLPGEIAAIDAVGRRYLQVKQVVCFDTAFHRTMPEAARRLALPGWVRDEGVERYGFHGLSYEFIVAHIGAADLGRAVIAHLGSGASLAAISGGRSVDTTMGLTPTGGVVMATRSGDLDPGVLLHLARRHDLDADALEHLVDQESGLLGLSGSTGDMQELLDRRRAGDDVAALDDRRVLPKCPQGRRRAGCGAGRPRHPRVHCRDRRERPGGPGADLQPLGPSRRRRSIRPPTGGAIRSSASGTVGSPSESCTRTRT